MQLINIYNTKYIELFLPGCGHYKKKKQYFNFVISYQKINKLSLPQTISDLEILFFYAPLVDASPHESAMCPCC